MPFLRRKPPIRFVVTTVSEPSGGFIPRGVSGDSPRPPPPTPPPPRPPRPPAATQVATESPWSDGGPLDVQSPKCRRRVCLPASLSIFRVLSSAQVICSRVGSRNRAGAPKALHWFVDAVS